MFFSSIPPPGRGVDRRVEDKDKAPEEDLVLPDESIRVEQRYHDTIDEVPPVRLLAAQDTEPVLKRCERADPPRKLDERRPKECRQVYPGPVHSLEEEKPAQDDEQDESAMNYDHQIGQEKVSHRCPDVMIRSIQQDDEETMRRASIKLKKYILCQQY